MVLICPNCEARLQLDEAKRPSQPFKVRCPKCQASVGVQSPAMSSEPHDTEGPQSTSAKDPTLPYERPASAPLFNNGSEDRQAASTGTTEAASATEIAKLLAEALSHTHAAPVRSPDAKRPAWDRRKALICCGPASRETIARSLSQNDYEVFVAESMAEALGRMREERMDIIILDANFDPLEQGVAFITREVMLLRPPERRRLFLVYLTSGARTMDLHAAFLQNVNLVLNPSDLEQLPEALEVSLRHYNELYRDFNRALETAPI